MTGPIRVRRARAADVPGLAPLLHMPAKRMYEQIAPDRSRALRIVEHDLRRVTLGSTWVAEVDGSIAGALVAYPYREDAARVRRLLWIALRLSPPWRWPAIARVFWRGHRAGLEHPADSLYVDGLGVDPAFRRRGVARALLERAARTAADNRLRSVALDTAETNAAAVALYRRTGFEPAARFTFGADVPALLAFERPVKRDASGPSLSP